MQHRSKLGVSTSDIQNPLNHEKSCPVIYEACGEVVGDYRDWVSFQPKEIPSSVQLYDDIFAYLHSDDRILDIGCGNGKSLLKLCKKGYHNVTGVDINESAIEYARALGAGTFVVGDATDLQFDDDSFTFGIMQALLTAIPHKKERCAVFREARRVLVDQAHLYIAEFAQTWHSELYRNRYLSGVRATKEEGSFPVYDKDTGIFRYVAHHYTEKELVKLLLDANFSILQFRYEVFTTHSGNKINGMVIIALNNKCKAPRLNKLV